MFVDINSEIISWKPGTFLYPETVNYRGNRQATEEKETGFAENC